MFIEILNNNNEIEIKEVLTFEERMKLLGWNQVIFIDEKNNEKEE